MIILIGPSASGKTELAKYLVNNYNYNKVITYTTREKRINEVDGKDYHFLTKQNFENLIKNDFFLETTFYNNNYYGTSKSSIKDNGLIILDPKGYNNFKKLIKINYLSIYLEASEETRLKRMLERKDKLEDALKRIDNDKLIFKPQELKVDYILNTENKTIEELAYFVDNLKKDPQ